MEKRALHDEAASGNLDAIERLLNEGADVNAVDATGTTALHIAADYGHDVVVERLVARGANVNATSRGGWTPLHHAAAKGHVGVARRLLNEGTNVNATTKYGGTALSLAAQRGHAAIVELLGGEGVVAVSDLGGDAGDMPGPARKSSAGYPDTSPPVVEAPPSSWLSWAVVLVIAAGVLGFAATQSTGKKCASFVDRNGMMRIYDTYEECRDLADTMKMMGAHGQAEAIMSAYNKSQGKVVILSILAIASGIGGIALYSMHRRKQEEYRAWKQQR